MFGSSHHYNLSTTFDIRGRSHLVVVSSFRGGNNGLITSGGSDPTIGSSRDEKTLLLSQVLKNRRRASC